MSESNFNFSWFGDLLFCKVPLHRYPGKSKRHSVIFFLKLSLHPPALSAENQKGVEDEEDTSDDMEAGEGEAGGARVGGGEEEGLVEVDQGAAADDVKHSACHAQQRLLRKIFAI